MVVVLFDFSARALAMEYRPEHYASAGKLAESVVEIDSSNILPIDGLMSRLKTRVLSLLDIDADDGTARKLSNVA